MARVSSNQTLTASPFSLLGFLPKNATSAPWFYALVCFASGLLASTLLAVVLPTYADEDDIRSFVSFATGAFICCFLLKKLPMNDVPKVEDTPSAKTAACVKEAPWARREKQGSSCLPPPPGLHSVSPSKVSPPPGLQGGPCDSAPWRYRAAPGLGRQARPVPEAPVIIKKTPQYEPKTFRKEVMAIMGDLASHKNVSRAVGEVRQWNVPADRQAAEFADILTYALEETRGNVRRTHIAFVGGLTGAFEKSECLAGLGFFFDGIFDGLCEEVAKLPRLTKMELLPTLNTVLSPEHVAAFVPEHVRTA